jgi:hypothetical protein
MFHQVPGAACLPIAAAARRATQMYRNRQNALNHIRNVKVLEVGYLVFTEQVHWYSPVSKA